jgi:hypothetical protein
MELARDKEMKSFNTLITKVESFSSNQGAVKSSQFMKLARDVQAKVDRETFDKYPELSSLREPAPLIQISLTQQTQLVSSSNTGPQSMSLQTSAP